jgi:hypothetical protein
MRFGRGRSFTQQLLAPAGEAPGGGGAPAAGAGGEPAGGAAGGAPPGPAVDLKHPEYLKHLAGYTEEVVKRERAAERERVLAEMKAEQEREKLSAEERLKGDLTAEKTRATKAENLAAEARAQSEFYRTLARSGLVPQDELAEMMAWEAAKTLAGDGKAVTVELLKTLATEKAWLFKPPPTAAPGSNPAAVAAASTLSTTPAAGSGAPPPGNGSAPKSAWDLSREEFASQVSGMSSGRQRS